MLKGDDAMKAESVPIPVWNPEGMRSGPEEGLTESERMVRDISRELDEARDELYGKGEKA